MIRIMMMVCGALALSASLLVGQSLPSLGVPYTVNQAVDADPILILDDLNGDGVQDFAGAFAIAGLGIPVYSGATGTVVRHVEGTADGFLIADATKVIGLDDIDGDVVDDYALHNINPALAAGGSTVVIRSASTDSTIFTFDSVSPGYVKLSTLRVLNTWPSGAPWGLAFMTTQNRLQVRHAATGVLMFSTQVPGSGGGIQIDDIGDADADGIEDLVLGVPGYSAPLPQAIDGVYVVSGADGSIIQCMERVALYADFGRGVKGLGDQDGDGLHEFLVFTRSLVPTSPTTGAGFVEIFSLLSDTPLYTVYAGIHDRFLRTKSSSDLDGDGCADFNVMVRRVLPGGNAFYLTQHYSGRTGVLIGESPWGGFSPYALHFDHGIRDSNGDGFGEILRLGPSPSTASVTEVSRRTLFGAAVYGAGTSGLGLAWEKGVIAPRAGHVSITGASSLAGLRLVASLEPANANLQAMGMSFPLLISADQIFVSEVLAADAQGELRIPETLQRPELAGVVVYLQCAELSPQAAVSNGLELLYGP